MRKPVGMHEVRGGKRTKTWIDLGHRNCTWFWCAALETNMCCTDCPKEIKLTCSFPCMNDPQRCRLCADKKDNIDAGQKGDGQN